MGCGRSKEKTPALLLNGARLQECTYDRRPKINVIVNPKVKKLDTKPRIIFIFGECYCFIRPTLFAFHRLFSHDFGACNVWQMYAGQKLLVHVMQDRIFIHING